MTCVVFIVFMYDYYVLYYYFDRLVQKKKKKTMRNCYKTVKIIDGTKSFILQFYIFDETPIAPPPSTLRFWMVINLLLVIFVSISTVRQIGNILFRFVARKPYHAYFNFPKPWIIIKRWHDSVDIMNNYASAAVTSLFVKSRRLSSGKSLLKNNRWFSTGFSFHIRTAINVTIKITGKIKYRVVFVVSKLINKSMFTHYECTRTPNVR